MTSQSGLQSRLRPEREEQLFAVVLELLREVGYDAMTIDSVASRGRSSKATLYRRWSGKQDLVVAALLHSKPLSFTDIDTGSLRGDLVETARRIGRVAHSDGALMAAMAHAAHTNPELARATREVVMAPETRAINEMLRRAAERGEITGDEPASAFCSHLFLSAVLARPVLEGEHAGVNYLVRLVDAVILPALGAPAGESVPDREETTPQRAHLIRCWRG